MTLGLFTSLAYLSSPERILGSGFALIAYLSSPEEDLGSGFAFDAYGIVKLWDVRQVVEIETYDFEPHPANSVKFDTSGACLAVASNDGSVKMLEIEKNKVSELSGHEDGVQSAMFNRNGEMLISASSDTTVKIWS